METVSRPVTVVETNGFVAEERVAVRV